MPPNLRSSGEKYEDTIAFIKSEEYAAIMQGIINAAVEKEVSHLKLIINELRNEIDILKQSNVDMIRLYANNADLNVNKNIKISKNINKITEPVRDISTTQALFAEKVKAVRPEKSLENIEKEKIIQSPMTNGKNTQLSDWKTVSYKKAGNNRRNNSVFGTTENTSIKGVQSYVHYHICKLEPEVEAENIVEYLKGKNINSVKCEKIASKRPDEYSSFKVSVPHTHKEQMLDPQLWPINVCINPFLARLIRKPNPK